MDWLSTGKKSRKHGLLNCCSEITEILLKPPKKQSKQSAINMASNPKMYYPFTKRKFSRPLQLESINFADDKINVTEKLKFVWDRVEKIVGKGENAGYHVFNGLLIQGR